MQQIYFNLATTHLAYIDDLQRCKTLFLQYLPNNGFIPELNETKTEVIIKVVGNAHQLRKLNLSLKSKLISWQRNDINRIHAKINHINWRPPATAVE